MLVDVLRFRKGCVALVVVVICRLKLRGAGVVFGRRDGGNFRVEWHVIKAAWKSGSEILSSFP
jgi:hypothetical protein